LGSQKKIKNIWSPTIKRRERKKIIKNETEVKENEEVDHLFENQEILNCGGQENESEGNKHQ